MGKRGHQGWSKKCLPVGTIKCRTRREGPGRRTHTVRFIKIRVDGPRPGQWIPLARYTWEAMHGPVPPGKRVVHLDGNTLHDEPSNYGLMTAGEVISLYHRLEPAMSEENRRGELRRKLTGEHNRLRGRIRRATSWLPTRWYAVDIAKREIHNQPFRSRRKLLEAFTGTTVERNGGISRRRLAALPIQAVRGAELSGDSFAGFAKREPDGTVYRPERLTAAQLGALFCPEQL